ncbi:MAG: hypothetical protein ACREJ3_04880, partial [Polyangiaceae bacterium]
AADEFNPSSAIDGTEVPDADVNGPGFGAGAEGAIGIGSGFSDTYGVALEARVGYSLGSGLYVGGAASYFMGQTVNTESAHATFLGGEVGYKYFATSRLEIRPYVFVGPAFVTQVSVAPFFVASKTDLAIQPGATVTLHLGRAFIGADARWLVTPAPNTLAILASGGVGF